jgi:hypothetical protein
MKMEATYTSKTSDDSQQTDGVIFQEIKLFITTVVRASYPAYSYWVFSHGSL